MIVPKKPDPARVGAGLRQPLQVEAPQPGITGPTPAIQPAIGSGVDGPELRNEHAFSRFCIKGSLSASDTQWRTL